MGIVGAPDVRAVRAADARAVAAAGAIFAGRRDRSAARPGDVPVVLRRFRRRGLVSPSVYVRWFRAVAAAHLLADREVTTLQAAHRLGFTTGGNFCRTIKAVTGLTSTEVRGVHGWNRLLVTYAWRHLGADALAAWETLDDLFVRAAA